MTILFFLFIPIIMVACGLVMYRCPLEKANAFVGYRTRRSRLSEDTWLFANRFCGKLWVKLGLALLVVSAIAVVLLILIEAEVSDTVFLIMEVAQLAVMLGSVIIVELELRRRFDANGNRRE